MSLGRSTLLLPHLGKSQGHLLRKAGTIIHTGFRRHSRRCTEAGNSDRRRRLTPTVSRSYPAIRVVRSGRLSASNLGTDKFCRELIHCLLGLAYTRQTRSIRLGNLAASGS